MKRKFRERPLVLKDLGEKEVNYEIIFGIIYAPRDSKIKENLFKIFKSTGKEYAIRLLSAVARGRVGVGFIRRVLISP